MHCRNQCAVYHTFVCVGNQDISITNMAGNCTNYLNVRLYIDYLLRQNVRHGKLWIMFSLPCCQCCWLRAPFRTRGRLLGTEPAYRILRSVLRHRWSPVRADGAFPAEGERQTRRRWTGFRTLIKVAVCLVGCPAWLSNLCKDTVCPQTGRQRSPVLLRYFCNGEQKINNIINKFYGE